MPPVRIDPEHLETMRHYTRALGGRWSARLMNIQFAIKDHRVYVLEVTPGLHARCFCLKGRAFPYTHRGFGDGRQASRNSILPRT